MKKVKMTIISENNNDEKAQKKNIVGKKPVSF